MRVRENKLFWLLIAILLVADAFVWLRIISPDKEALELYFLDVGQGDSSLIVLESGERILVDGGRFSGPILENLEKALGLSEKYIDLVLMTHSDEDHFGGLIKVLERYEVGAFLGNGRLGSSEAYERLSALLDRKKVPYIRLAEGDRVALQEASLEFLSPSPSELLSDELNDSSLVFLFRNKDFSVLYTGDASQATEERIVEKYDVKTDILAVGHHGSKTSSAELFLAEALPSFSIIGVGENNYGHPNAEVLERLSRYSGVFRTDKHGLMMLKARDGRLELLQLK